MSVSESARVQVHVSSQSIENQKYEILMTSINIARSFVPPPPACDYTTHAPINIHKQRKGFCPRGPLHNPFAQEFLLFFFMANVLIEKRLLRTGVVKKLMQFLPFALFSLVYFITSTQPFFSCLLSSNMHYLS